MSWTLLSLSDTISSFLSKAEIIDSEIILFKELFEASRAVT